jgi:hypothetical protein
MEIIKTYSLYLNSRERTNGTSNNCTFNINPAITLSNSANRFIVCCETCEIPYSFNQINSNYNRLDYVYFNTATVDSYNSTLIIPIGNYNINNLITTFVNLLVADINTRRPLLAVTAANFIVTYNPNTSLVTFALTGAVTTNFSFRFNFSLNYVLALCFGFPEVDYFLTGVAPLTSVNKVQVNPVSAIYLRSDTLKFSTSFEAIVSKYQQADILVKIPVPTLPNTLIYYRGEQKQMLSNIEISSLNFYWTDNLDVGFNPLDLRGLNYGIYLTFSEVQIKPNNAGLDKLTPEGIGMPKTFMNERDKLLNELVEAKLKLEKEVEEAKKKNEDKKVDEKK